MTREEAHQALVGLKDTLDDIVAANAASLNVPLPKTLYSKNITIEEWNQLLTAMQAMLDNSEKMRQLEEGIVNSCEAIFSYIGGTPVDENKAFYGDVSFYGNVNFKGDYKFFNLLGVLDGGWETLPPAENYSIGDAFFIPEPGTGSPLNLCVITWDGTGRKQWVNIGRLAKEWSVVDSDFDLNSDNPVANSKITKALGACDVLTDLNQVNIISKRLPFQYEGKRYTYSADTERDTIKYVSVDVNQGEHEVDGVTIYIIYFAKAPNYELLAQEEQTIGSASDMLTVDDIDNMWEA